MKKASRMFMGVAMVAFMLLSCNDINGNASDNAETAILYGNDGTFSDISNPAFPQKKGGYEITKMPVMDSRVVSYKIYNGPVNSPAASSSSWDFSPITGYARGFTDDNYVLTSWFRSIFDGKQTEDECNYFALYFANSSSLLFNHRLILSKDMALHAITCNIDIEKESVISMDIVYETMLICDDKAGTLRKSIDIDSIRIYRNPNWNCGIRLKEEDVYFSTAISDDVKKWMKEQLASKGSEKRLVMISDMYFAIGIGKRNLSVPGKIISDDSSSWVVLITAEELAGLKYGDLAIEFEQDAQELP